MPVYIYSSKNDELVIVYLMEKVLTAKDSKINIRIIVNHAK